jgi:hypothetical protein
MPEASAPCPPAPCPQVGTNQIVFLEMDSEVTDASGGLDIPVYLHRQ